MTGLSINPLLKNTISFKDFEFDIFPPKLKSIKSNGYSISNFAETLVTSCLLVFVPL